MKTLKSILFGFVLGMMVGIATFPATVFAGRPTVPIEPADEGPATKPPCWVKLNETTTVDARRIVGYVIDGTDLTVYVTGMTHDGYNSWSTYTNYLPDIKAKIVECFR